MTQSELDVEKSVCNTTLKEFLNEAHYLRAGVLKQERITAISRGDNKKTITLLEKNKKKWKAK